MWVLQARSLFANRDLDPSFVLHRYGSCHSQGRLRYAKAVISSAWKSGESIRY